MHARDESGTLIGFYYFERSGPTVKFGLGLRPDLTGGGRGLDFVRAVLDVGRARFAPPCFRLTVAAFNVRAQRVYARGGFRVVGRFTRGGEPAAPEFLLMVEE